MICLNGKFGEVNVGEITRGNMFEDGKEVGIGSIGGTVTCTESEGNGEGGSIIDMIKEFEEGGGKGG